MLNDHKRVKSKLVAPMNAALGAIREVSWTKTMIPELLWIALLHDALGERRAVEVITNFTRAVRAHSSEYETTIWAAAGKFSSVPQHALRRIVAGMSTKFANDLRSALAPLAANYPTHPLNAIYDPVVPLADHVSLDQLRRVVEGMYDRSSRSTVMVQACAVWIAFDTGRLKVASHLSAAEFPRIEDYPKTELSQRIASFIRASLNMMFGDMQTMASNGEWPIEFWNRGLQLQACEVQHG